MTKSSMFLTEYPERLDSALLAKRRVRNGVRGFHLSRNMSFCGYSKLYRESYDTCSIFDGKHNFARLEAVSHSQTLFLWSSGADSKPLFCSYFLRLHLHTKAPNQISEGMSEVKGYWGRREQGPKVDRQPSLPPLARDHQE